MMKVVFMKFMDLQMHHLKPAIVLFTSDASCVNAMALLCSKSRLAPSKSTTIPRLELSACVLLFEHFKSIILALSKQISIKNVCCWSDSLIALWWIKQNHKTWKLWIQKRVQKIREKVNTEHWNYVISENNSADIAIRRSSSNSLLKNLLWWNGPSFLEGAEDS